MPDCNHSTDDPKPTKAGTLLTALVLGPIFRPLLLTRSANMASQHSVSLCVGLQFVGSDRIAVPGHAGNRERFQSMNR